MSSEVPGHSSKFQKARTDEIFMAKEKDLSGGLRNDERPEAKCTCRLTRDGLEHSTRLE